MLKDNSFSAACYDNNSIDELREALKIGPDMDDCKVWEITPDEWVEQVKAALVEKESELNEES